MSDSEDTQFDRSEYVLGMSYTHNYHEELDPLMMSFLTHWKTNHGVSAEREFNYFELGCGNGVTVNIMAAANSHGTFYANDFNPEHCKNTKALAKEGGVKNLTVLEASFEDLLSYDLPKFDFISLHGILSWVSNENRGFIVKFIDRFLAEDGIVYSSYNCAAGNAGFAPVQRMLREFSDALSGPFDERVRSSFNFLWNAKDDMPFFRVFEDEKRKLEKFSKKNRHYVAHELFNYDWKNFYHKDLVDEFGNVGLEYFASRELEQNFPEYLMSPELLNKYRSIESMELKNMFEDLSVGKSFRKDLYKRENEIGSEGDMKPWLDQTRVVAIRSSDELTEELSIPVGKVRLDSKAYWGIMDTIDDGALSLSEILDRIQMSQDDISIFLDRVNKLIAFGFVKVCFSERRVKINAASALRYNSAVLGKTIDGRRHGYFASPLLGTGVKVDRLDQHFVVGEGKEQNVLEYAFQKAMDEKLSFIFDENSELKSKSVLRQFIEERYQTFQEDVLPRLKQLGIEFQYQGL